MCRTCEKCRRYTAKQMISCHACDLYVYVQKKCKNELYIHVVTSTSCLPQDMSRDMFSGKQEVLITPIEKQICVVLIATPTTHTVTVAEGLDHLKPVELTS
jgi:hypothetical protein